MFVDVVRILVSGVDHSLSSIVSLDFKGLIKEDILNDLIEMDYKQVDSGKVLGKLENKKNTNKYDYLIKMSIYSFTEDEIEKLNKDISKLQTEYDSLFNKDIEDIWLEECKSFTKQYKKMKLKS